MGWSYSIVRCLPQADDPAVRTELGGLRPVEAVTLSEELNREGECVFPVRPDTVPDDIRALFRGDTDGRAELVVEYNDEGVVWSGPLVGWEKKSRERIDLKFMSDLYYLQMMKINGRYVSAGTDVWTFLGAIFDDMLTRFGPLSDRVTSYMDWGLERTSGYTAGYNITPGNMGEPAIDLRDGKSFLEVIQGYADTDPAHRFDFQMTRVLPTSKPSLGFGGERNNDREFGRDLRNSVILTERHLIRDVGVSLSMTVENLCTAVLAVSSGSGSDVTVEERTVGAGGAITTVAAASTSDDRPYHYAVATETLRGRYGHIVHSVQAPQGLSGVAAGELARDPSNIDPYSLEGYAEAWLAERTLPWILPRDFTLAARREPTDDGFDPYFLRAGDRITLDIDTGFGRGQSREARIAKKVITVDRVPRMQLEFV